MISLWIRELAGWGLVAVSVFLAFVALSFLNSRQVVEAGVLVLLVLGMLRAGISLVRIATAARIAASDKL